MTDAPESPESTADPAARFRRLRPLGQGGMGVVYEALDTETGARVALKTLHSADAEHFVRLKEEFRALAGIHHPALVQLYELVVSRDRCMLAMELVEGTSFIEWVRPGIQLSSPLASGSESETETDPDPSSGSPRQARDLGGVLDLSRLRSALPQLVEGLGALHEAGKIHRDLKPKNVMVTASGRVKIFDFGLTIRQGERAQELAGTPVYISPEQLTGGVITPAVDWYALGVMLYQCLTGRTPYAEQSSPLLAKTKRRAVAVRDLAPDAAADLADLADRLLAIDPGMRPTGREIAERVGGHAYRDKRGDGGDLVGRATEVATLLATVDASRRSSEARLLLVSGPSGVGKTALVEEVSRRVEHGLGGVVLRGRCSEREVVAYPGLDGIVDGLRAVLAQGRFEHIRAESPDAIHDLAQLFPVVEDRVVALDEVVDAMGARITAASGLRDLLSRLAASVPVVLVLDDMQWITDDAAGILAGALGETGGPSVPVAVLGTVRPTTATERPGQPSQALARSIALHADVLPLDELGEEASRAIVTRLAGHAMSDDSVDRLLRAAGGHPLLLEILARSWSSTAAPGDGDRALLDLPLAGADALLRVVLDHVAIASEGITLQCLARVVQAELAHLVGVTNELARLRLVRVSGIGKRASVTVAHDRIRAAALATLSAAERRRMHQAIGLATEALEPERVEVLVHHFEAANDAPRVRRYARAAGDAAARVLAFDRAARWYELAIEHGEAPDAELRAARASVLALAGRAADAAREYERAATEPGATAGLLQRATDQHLRAGEADRGIALLGGVLRPFRIMVPSTPLGSLLALLMRRAQLWLRGVRYRARPAAELDGDRLERVDALSAAASGLALVDNILGSYFQTTSLLLALDAGEPGRVARALAVEASYSSADGPRSRKRTARLLEETERAARAVGTSEARAWSRAAVAFASTLEARWVVGLESARDATRVFRAECPGSIWEISTLRLFESFCLAYLGRWGELRRLVEERHRDATVRGDVHARVIQSTSTPMISLAACDEPWLALTRATVAKVDGSSEAFRVEHWWRYYGTTQTLLYCGDVEGAVVETERTWPALERSLLLMVHLTRCEANYTRASVALAALVAKFGDPAKHERTLARATKRLLKEKSLFGRALGLAVAAAHARLRGDAAASEASLMDALATFESAGMASHVAAVRWSLAKMHGDRASQLRAEQALVAFGVIRPRRFVAFLVAAHDLADPASARARELVAARASDQVTTLVEAREQAKS
ncbi:MAG: protein kinase [Polyangiaceae bacterium]